MIVHDKLQPAPFSVAFIMTIDHLFIEFAGLQLVNECGLTYTLQSHFALEEVMHLIPQNVLISGDDRIPGISEVGTDAGIYVKKYRKKSESRHL